METYNAMREFADSWGLLAMTVFFLGVVVSVFLPGAKAKADAAAQIPFDETGPAERARAARAAEEN